MGLLQNYFKMKRLAQYGLALAFFILVIEVIRIAPKTVDETAQKTSPSKASDTADQVMHGAHLVETREGQKEWELWASEAVSYKNLDRWNLIGVKVIFFGKSGVFFTVTGKKGIVETKTKNLRIEGDVITKSSNGYTFKTEMVDYKSLEHMLMSPQQVKMVGPDDKQGGGLKLKGEEMSLDVQTSLMHIKKKVETQKKFSDTKHLMIHSDDAQFSGNSKLARFFNHVVMDVETMRVTGKEAQFVYDSESAQVTSVLVQGRVRLTDIDKWATSDHMTANLVNDTYVFEGKPRVVQNNDELVGDKITLLQGGKRVQVEQARARMDQKRLETKH